jgi:LysR family glycine cleavage system transcriptional activator
MAKFRLPPLNALRAFEAAARHQSIKKAAGELNVTPGAVGRHIVKLERQVGRGLFERFHRRIALTDAGKVLLDALTTGFSGIQHALLQLGERPTLEKLVISADPDFAGLWLVPRLADFRAMVPNTLIEIQAEKPSAVSHDPRISCAIHYAEADHGVGEMLFRSKLFPVCASWAPLESPCDLRHRVLLHDRSIAEWEEFLRSYPATSTINVRSGIVFSEKRPLPGGRGSRAGGRDRRRFPRRQVFIGRAIDEAVCLGHALEERILSAGFRRRCESPDRDDISRLAVANYRAAARR